MVRSFPYQYQHLRRVVSGNNSQVLNNFEATKSTLNYTLPQPQPSFLFYITNNHICFIIVFWFNFTL